MHDLSVRSVDELVKQARELGELVNGRPENVEQVVPQLDTILTESGDVRVVVEAVTALGCAMHPHAAEVMLGRVDVDHPDVAVRLALARALPCGVDAGTKSWDRVVSALIKLSGDGEAQVRDWACLGLYLSEASSMPARDALALRLSDPDDDTRCEALRALAATGDDRARTALEERLAEDDGAIYELELETAAALADPKLYPLLLRIDEGWRGDDDEMTRALAHALGRCHPDASMLAAEVEGALVGRVNALLAAPGSSQDLTVCVAGSYPWTRLIVSRPEASHGDGFDFDIWQGFECIEPTGYPMEQMAGTAVLALHGTGTDR